MVCICCLAANTRDIIGVVLIICSCCYNSSIDITFTIISRVKYHCHDCNFARNTLENGEKIIARTTRSVPTNNRKPRCISRGETNSGVVAKQILVLTGVSIHFRCSLESQSRYVYVYRAISFTFNSHHF